MYTHLLISLWITSHVVSWLSESPQNLEDFPQISLVFEGFPLLYPQKIIFYALA